MRQAITCCTVAMQAIPGTAVDSGTSSRETSLAATLVAEGAMFSLFVLWMCLLLLFQNMDLSFMVTSISQ